MDLKEKLIKKSEKLKEKGKMESVCLRIKECDYVAHSLIEEFCGKNTKINHKNVGAYLTYVCNRYPQLCKLDKKY